MGEAIMSATWWAIIIASIGAYIQKILGMSVPKKVLEHPITIRVAALIPVAFLGALVAVQTLSTGQEIVLDARVAGIGVAAILLALRAPFLVVVVSAAVVAAAIRML